MEGASVHFPPGRQFVLWEGSVVTGREEERRCWVVEDGAVVTPLLEVGGPGLEQPVGDQWQWGAGTEGAVSVVVASGGPGAEYKVGGHSWIAGAGR